MGSFVNILRTSPVTRTHATHEEHTAVRGTMRTGQLALQLHSAVPVDGALVGMTTNRFRRGVGREGERERADDSTLVECVRVSSL